MTILVLFKIKHRFPRRSQPSPDEEPQGLEEACDRLKGNSKVTLWCDGLMVEPSGKRGRR